MSSMGKNSGRRQEEEEYATACEDIYSGNEGALWELLMGRHIHIGGMYTSMELAQKAGLRSFMNGIDLCCNNGEGSRFLIKETGVSSITGVDISSRAIQRGIERCFEQGITSKQISFINGSVSDGLPMIKDNAFDFGWSQDAFCYIPDRLGLIKTLKRVIKHNGIIAFTDWIGGTNYDRMTSSEYKRYTTLMTFPNVETIDSYKNKLESVNCTMMHAYDTKQFLPCIQLYLRMITLQHRADVLTIYKNNKSALKQLISDFEFMLDLAKQDKVCHGLFVAKVNKNGYKSKL